MTALAQRFTEALDCARIAHATQVRKGTQITYDSQLIGVASLVLDCGGDEDQAIAGLLHDLLEDCGSAREPVIRFKFGDAVIAIVNDCTDGSAEPKEQARTPGQKYANWLERKRVYIAHLAQEPMASLLVSACDKLHNARSVVADLQGDAGPRVFERFTAGREGTLQCYEAIARIFLKKVLVLQGRPGRHEHAPGAISLAVSYGNPPESSPLVDPWRRWPAHLSIKLVNNRPHIRFCRKRKPRSPHNDLTH